MGKNIEIAPSILAADFRFLEREVKAVADAGADRIHCDIMDGQFVPNISFGPMVVAAVKKCVSIPLDVHLMLSSPENYIAAFSDAGADVITVHADACRDLPYVLKTIRSRGIQAGVTVNPDKPIALFTEHLALVDLVLIMSVYAGFGGQTFMVETMEKVAAVAALRKSQGLTFDIEVDGGVNGETASVCLQHGANVLVAGSYIFGHPNYRSQIAKLREYPPKERGDENANNN